MNILPKKRWHVRTKENIARVRKDEAEALEKEKEEKLRTDKADREARLNVLKHKSKQKLLEHGIAEPGSEIALPAKHINLFANFKDAIKTTNKEHVKEVKDKKEEYEKKIGYLTYLGQDTNEALGKKNWYEVLPGSSRDSRSHEIKDTYDKLVLKDADGKLKTKEPNEVNGEICWKTKQRHDPINAFKHLHSYKDKKSYSKTKDEKIYINNVAIKKKNKHKHKRKKHSSDKDEEKEKKLQKLRDARLKREQHEKYKTEIFLTGLNQPLNTEPEKVTVKPKYNSQFNPELARQNYR